MVKVENKNYKTRQGGSIFCPKSDPSGSESDLGRSRELDRSRTSPKQGDICPEMDQTRFFSFKKQFLFFHVGLVYKPELSMFPCILLCFAVKTLCFVLFCCELPSVSYFSLYFVVCCCQHLILLCIFMCFAANTLFFNVFCCVFAVTTLKKAGLPPQRLSGQCRSHPA